MGVFSIITLINNIFTLGKTIFQAVMDAIAQHLKDQAKKKAQEASDAYKKAQEIKDDEARIKAKADAACKLEKLGDPSSDCDAPPPGGVSKGP